MKEIVIIIIGFLLSSCAVNHGFPREVEGLLKPINAEVVKR